MFGGAAHPSEGLCKAVDLVIVLRAREAGDLEEEIIEPGGRRGQDHMAALDQAGEEIEPGHLVADRFDCLDWEIAVLAQRELFPNLGDTT